MDRNRFKKFRPHKFDPERPTCALCNAPLTQDMELFTLRYDDKNCTVHNRQCAKCGAKTAYVVMDDPDQNVDYVGKEIS